MISRLQFGKQPCLFESVTVAASLRRLGVPVQVAVGYLTMANSKADTVHAWLVLRQHVVSVDVLPAHYAELARYP